MNVFNCYEKLVKKEDVLKIKKIFHNKVTFNVLLNSCGHNYNFLTFIAFKQILNLLIFKRHLTDLSISTYLNLKSSMTL